MLIDQSLPRYFFPLYTLLPILTFWTTSSIFYFGGFDSEKNISNPKNTVTLKGTLIRMIQLHILQILSLLPMEAGYLMDPDKIHGCRLRYIMAGILLLDIIEYTVHRLYHTFPFLYQHVHKTHHEMKTPWSFGCLYNSYTEAVLTSLVISAFFFPIFQFTLEEFTYVTTIGVFWTCMDHCDYFDHVSFLGRKEHHRQHHEININKNFQQPFFIFLDNLFGTKLSIQPALTRPFFDSDR
jgi:sterol desaturase/sphingolipid hydroxylase (fatty acid hydroxylase superfamily)